MAQLTIQQVFNLALQHHRSGRLAQAQQMYGQILAQQPNHVEALRWLGILAAQTGHGDAAVELIGRAAALRPSDAALHSDLGNALGGAGRLDEAIAAYRRAIALNPGVAQIHYNLGLALKRHGQLDEAIAAYRQAIAVNGDYAEAHANLGNALGDQGRLEEAIAAHRQAIAVKPDFFQAHYNLGTALGDQGRLEEAIAAYRQAISLRPDYAQAHCSLGKALKDKGQVEEAIAAYRQAIALKGDFAEAHCNLGNALKEQRQLHEAIAAYRQAISLKPDYAEAHCNLGNAFKEQGHLDEAVAAYRQAIAIKPGYAEAHCDLGIALKDQGQLDEAMAAYRQAIALKPDYAEAHSNLGNALSDKGHLDEAMAAHCQAIALKPGWAEAHYNLGNVWHTKRQMDEAVAAYRQAIALQPGFPEAYLNLGNAYKDQGQIDPALDCYRKAMALKGQDASAHSNFCLTLYYHPAYQAGAILAETRRWVQRHALPLAGEIRPAGNEVSADRRLKVGYVSPNFLDHPVGRFCVPLLANHDHQRFEIFGYSDVRAKDAITQRLQGCCDHWCDVGGLGDAELAEKIRGDGIDILVDLAAHTGGNRLLVFARKPVPVQVSYLAYCGTTGLETIDYRLSDPYLDPPGADDSIYSERTIRLPETYWCYEPNALAPEVNGLPVLKHGGITFGCLNNFCKISEATLGVWADLLRAVPTSRLLLHAHQGSHRQWLHERLAAQGIEPVRVQFASRVPIKEYFALYHQIDIALDTFPYAGGTTTCDTLWMSVPLVSLVGKTAVGRGGFSILSNVGLPELVGRSEQEYVRLARDLAHDVGRLAHLRSTIRQRMQLSPLMDAPRFARNVEAAYRQMWRTWCQKGSLWPN